MVGRSWIGPDLAPILDLRDECFPLCPPFETKVMMGMLGKCRSQHPAGAFICSRLAGHTREARRLRRRASAGGVGVNWTLILVIVGTIWLVKTIKGE